MSQVSIANRALALVGANKITSLSDGTEEAKAVSNMYEGSLRSILSEACWGFALKRDKLNMLTIKPAWGKGNYFQLPSDYVRVFGVMDDNVKWRIEGDRILADSDDFGILYTYMMRDDALYMPSFVDALACRLAFDICFDLTNSSSKQEELINLYRGEYLPIAKSENARDKNIDFIKDDAWVNAVHCWRAD